jgi:hypothetical protein
MRSDGSKVSNIAVVMLDTRSPNLEPLAHASVPLRDVTALSLAYCEFSVK